MGLAYPMQKFQDWFTQQWAILFGKKIDPNDYPWLMGPFGNLKGIGEGFIHQLAEKEDLVIQRDLPSQGLIPSFDVFHFSEKELSQIFPQIIDFYEKTSNYHLHLRVKWNPFFKVFGILVNKLFSNRINQLNIPTSNKHNQQSLKSEIITLVDKVTHTVKYTIWLRTTLESKQVMYAGVYGTCTLPSGKICVKAVFPLPQGNATVIMQPYIGPNGEFILDSSGKKIGDAGFYFLLKDRKGKHWAHFISSFRDKLTVFYDYTEMKAEQQLTLWNKKVIRFQYKMERK